MTINLLIIGHDGCGKDAAAAILGLTHMSSSQAMMEDVIFPALVEEYPLRFSLSPGGKMLYTKEGMVTCRAVSPVEVGQIISKNLGYRKIAKLAINAAKKHDETIIAKKIFKSCSVYVGMRTMVEFEAVMDMGVVDLVIYIDSIKRGMNIGCEIPHWKADVVIDNNNSIDDMARQIRVMAATAISMYSRGKTNDI